MYDAWMRIMYVCCGCVYYFLPSFLPSFLLPVHARRGHACMRYAHGGVIIVVIFCACLYWVIFLVFMGLFLGGCDCGHSFSFNEEEGGKPFRLIEFHVESQSRKNINNTRNYTKNTGSSCTMLGTRVCACCIYMYFSIGVVIPVFYFVDLFCYVSIIILYNIV